MAQAVVWVGPSVHAHTRDVVIHGSLAHVAVWGSDAYRTADELGISKTLWP